MPQPQNKTLVERELEVLFGELKSHKADTKEYDSVLDRITKLHKLRIEEKPQRPSPDTLVNAAVYFIGIVMILKHEELNFITTKAMSFVPKLR